VEARQRSRLRLRRAVVALIAGVAPSSLAQPAPADAECKPVTVETRRIGGRTVERIYGEPTTVEFVAGMMIDADGALRAYHPDDASGLDRIEHAGASGNWWGIVTEDGTPGGEPVVQGDGDPAPGFHVSQTSLADPDKEVADPQRYVDAVAVPYVALQEVFVAELGCKLGDFAVVTREAGSGSTRTSAAIFADVASAELPVGEGSIALAERLGVPPDPRSGGTHRASVHYVLFCGSGTERPRSVAEIDAEGARLAAARRIRDAAACPRR
jgi:Fungal chitosanase of glycosyl hydrolase group 75